MGFSGRVFLLVLKHWAFSSCPCITMHGQRGKAEFGVQVVSSVLEPLIYLETMRIRNARVSGSNPLTGSS